MPQKTVVIIGGPTASGKTSAAIRLAQHYRTEIISADSRQCYREMRIGVARPSDEELGLVPHHFIASHSIHDPVNAAVFEAYALQKAAELFQKYDTIIMVGGTGLYIRAFCDGFDVLPEIPESVRDNIRSAYAQMGLAWLQAEVEKSDPLFYAKGEIQNPQRLMRALEVLKTTGRSLVSFQSGSKAVRPFRTVKIALDLPKEDLHRNINARVDLMMEQGLLNEVQALIPFQHLNALQTVGYRELFAYFNGTLTLEAAVETIKRNTRLYAKRQLTWFRKDPAFAHFHPADADAISAFLMRGTDSST